MINQFLKISALVVTGRFLKPRLKGLLLLLSAWFLITWLHSEYIDYVTLSGNTDFLIEASLIKLLAYLLVFSAYFLLVERRLLLKTRPTPSTNLNATARSGEAGKASIGQQANAEPVSSAPTEGADDGFDFIRRKRKLQGSSEKLLHRDTDSTSR